MTIKKDNNPKTKVNSKKLTNNKNRNDADTTLCDKNNVNYSSSPLKLNSALNDNFPPLSERGGFATTNDNSPYYSLGDGAD